MKMPMQIEVVCGRDCRHKMSIKSYATAAFLQDSGAYVSKAMFESGGTGSLYDAYCTPCTVETVHKVSRSLWSHDVVPRVVGMEGKPEEAEEPLLANEGGPPSNFVSRSQSSLRRTMSEALADYEAQEKAHLESARVRIS